MSIADWFARLFGSRQTRGEEETDPGMGMADTEDAEDTGDADETAMDDASDAGLELASPEDLDQVTCPIPARQIDRWFYPWLFDLQAFEDQQPTAAEVSLLNTLKQIVASPRLSTQLVPRLPLVIPQLMRSLKDEHLSGAQLARQIAKDPALVGEVIRVANSPYYRRAHKIASLEQAIVLLGRDGLHQLIARVAFYPIFNLRGGQIIHQAAARVWGQSERCALVCHCLARRFKQDVFAAYLSGLVANLGLIVGLRLMDQRLDLSRYPLPRAESFYLELIGLARQLSQRVIEEWNFPAGVIRAISEQAEPNGEGTRSMLGYCLGLGDRYSKLNLLLDKGRLSAEDLDPTALLADPCYRRLLVEASG